MIGLSPSRRSLSSTLTYSILDGDEEQSGNVSLWVEQPGKISIVHEQSPVLNKFPDVVDDHDKDHRSNKLRIHTSGGQSDGTSLDQMDLFLSSQGLDS